MRFGYPTPHKQRAPKSERHRRVRRCAVCGELLPGPVPQGGRRRVYCSNACRQRAKRERDKQVPA